MQHHRKPGLLNISLVCFFAATIISAHAAAPNTSADVKFRFAPPNGTSYTKKYKFTEESTNDNGTRNVSTTEYDDHVHMIKCPGGYLETHKPSNFVMTEDGYPLTESDDYYYIQQFGQCAQLSYQLDDKGHFVSVHEGDKESIEKAKAKLKPGSPAIEALSKDVALLATYFLSSSSEMLNSFVGHSEKVGASWTMPWTHKTSDGIVYKATKTYKTVGWVKCYGTDCLRILCTASATPADSDKLQEDNSTDTPKVYSRKFILKQEYLIDPNTMLFYHEIYNSTFSVTYSENGRNSKTYTYRQWAESTYEYEKVKSIPQPKQEPAKPAEYPNSDIA